MKQLILLRHGEAGFSDGVDFQRQLTPKGKENLNRLGDTLRKTDLKVDLVYCSAATRTQETAEIIKKYISIDEMEVTREIYQGNMEALLKLIEKTPKMVDTCLFIGHNPTISLLLSHLTHGNYLGLQPGMMAVIDLEINEWYMIGLGTGILREILE